MPDDETIGRPPDRMCHITAVATNAAKCMATAEWILEEFDAYYRESRAIPRQAQSAFERRDPGASLALSKRRLSIYSESIHALGPGIAEAFPLLTEKESLWRKIEDIYLSRIEGRYEADLAFAFLHSVRRKISQDEWKPVEYGFGDPARLAAGTAVKNTRCLPGSERFSPETALEILAIPAFQTPYQDAAEDAFLIAERVNEAIVAQDRRDARIEKVEMIDAGFFRNRGAYLVGRVVLRNAAVMPLVIALLNDEDGIFVDAVLTSEADTHNIFSSTLANFHVTNTAYHELSAFLHSIMPNRALGLHYSTIGFNHVGKVAVMNELKAELARFDEVFDTAAGFPGSVAIAFSAPSSAYVLKVIRDTPTAQYKWGQFEGLDSVLEKYRRVHEINRTGSMLDNIIYYNLRLDRRWFAPALLEELVSYAGGSVSALGDFAVFKHLIVQPKMIPLPVFLKTAPQSEAEVAIVNLGHCIKNNAAANIFNKDLDGRNYGVSRYLKVYLFDYDALEPFTEVKIRTNQDRVDGEEDIPEWFFEDGIVFLPEEVGAGLRIENRSLIRLFREVHGDLFSTDYWQKIQDSLRGGHVPSISIYPEERRILRDLFRLGAYH